MLIKIVSLSNLTLLVALALSTVAAYYSIIGLTAIFAGAVIPVIIMGTVLEVGKITTTVWLRKYWKRAGILLKIYLVPAVVALALLTSMGIFGFLSKAHMEHGINTGDSQAKVSLYDEKIKTQRDNIDLARKALIQMDNQVDQRLSRGDSENSAERAVAIRRQQAGERTKLQKEIGDAQKEIAKLNEERAPIAAENRKVEAEVGPIKYIAALIYGDNADQNMLESAVRWVIILLVIVFDPLAIALVLAANASKEWDDAEPVKEEPAYEPDDGPLTDEQIDQIKANDILNRGVTNSNPADNIPISHLFEIVEPIKCYKCGTELINAPGIGPFCPNKECDVMDNTLGADPIELVEPKPLLEQHPYLTEHFEHFTNLKPMVYKPEPEVIEPTVDNTVIVIPGKPYKELDGGYVTFEGKHLQLDALKSLHPELFMLTADTVRPINTNFGIKFPNTAVKGDIFVRVDMLPNKVYKYTTNNWIEINKAQSDTYLHNQKYVQYLVEKIDKGEYDLDLLSETEKEQIELYLKNQNI